jgi:hypothetical protein
VANIHEALGSIPSTTKKERRRREGKKEKKGAAKLGQRDRGGQRSGVMGK